jgi:hypothetical protein
MILTPGLLINTYFLYCNQFLSSKLNILGLNYGLVLFELRPSYFRPIEGVLKNEGLVPEARILSVAKRKGYSEARDNLFERDRELVSLLES